MIRITSNTAEYLMVLKKYDLALNIACAQAVNTVAGFAYTAQIKNLRKSMILRNKYTENSLRFFPANEKTPKESSYQKKYIVKQDLDRIAAVVGSVSPYLALQDKGGIQRPKPGARFVVMPTTAGRGGAWNRAIPKSLRLGPSGDVGNFGASKKGIQLFVLPSGIYYRKGKPHKGSRAPTGSPRASRPIVMVRTLEKTAQSVQGTKFHESAMKGIGTWQNMDRAFAQSAKALFGRIQSNNGKID